MNHCKSVLEIFSAEIEKREKKAGGTFNLLKVVCKVEADDGAILAGNVEFPCDESMVPPSTGRYHVRYEPRRDWQDGKIKPVAVEFIPVNKPAPAAPRPSAS